MTAHTVTLALKGWFTKPLNKLPQEKRGCAEAYIKNWSELSPRERRERAVEVDCQRSVKADIRLTRARRAQERNSTSTAGRAEQIIAWYDDVMDADHWFNLADVEPVKAAMLLCQFNPNEITFAAAELSTNDETGPRDLVRLRQRFEDLSRAEPRSRKLADWLGAAHQLKLKQHSWIDTYVAAAGIQVGEALGGQTEVASVPPPVAEPVPPGAAGLPPETSPASAIKTLDYSKLVTRKALIDAFGSFTGMNGTWFKNLKDTPKLRDARKDNGQGGRGHIKEPLFCPYEVMQWQIDPLKKKGRRMSPTNGWRMLKAHFSVVYADHAREEPSAD